MAWLTEEPKTPPVPSDVRIEAGFVNLERRFKMNEEKRKRLEAAGWKIGEVDEFLGLTPEEAAIVDIKFNLALAEKNFYIWLRGNFYVCC